MSKLDLPVADIQLIVLALETLRLEYKLRALSSQGARGTAEIEKLCRNVQAKIRGQVSDV